MVEVWLAKPSALDVDALGEVLSPDERRQAAGYTSEQARREFVAGRALTRLLLSRRRPEVQPGEWRFELGERDKPAVSGHPLRFNLSHAGDLVALAISEHEVGVDVEARRPRRCLDIARDFFSEQERVELEELRGDEQQARFFALWTLKEAYAKARGLGMAVQLHHTRFAPSGEVSFDPALDDDPGRWWFGSYRPTGAHFLALAVRRDPGAAPRAELRHLSPLACSAMLCGHPSRPM